MCKSRIITLAFVFLFAFKIKAQNQLDEVVVTANKFPQKLSETGKTLIILTDSVLRQSSFMSLGALLNRQAGIVIVGSNNVLGSNQDIRLRGASAGNTLILIDGIPAYDPSNISNAYDLNNFSVSQIERIEILKGSQSTLYGSDAVAGVVNIITKKNAQKQSSSGLVSVGSYKTLNTQAGFGNSLGKLNYSMHFGRIKTAGFSAAAINPLLSSMPNVDKDGYEQNTSQIQFNAQLTKKLYWKAQALSTQYKADLDAGAYIDDRDFKATNNNKQISSGLEYEYKQGKIYLNYAWNDTKRVYTDDSTHVPVGAFSKYSKSSYEAQSNFLEVYTKNSANEHLDWLLGADFRTQNTDQTYHSISSYGIYDAPALQKKDAFSNTKSLFGSVFIKNINNFYAEIGARFNSHSVYGNNATYSINPSYFFNKSLKGFANISSGFKAPSLYQLYSLFGNRNLEPETTKSLETGLAWATEKEQIRLTIFNRNTNNLIVFQPLQREPYGIYANLSTQKNSGFEIESNFKIHKKLTFNGNYTFIKGEELFRVPKHLLNLSLAYQANKDLFFSLNSRFVGDRTDLFFDEATYESKIQTLKAYQLIDCYAAYNILGNMKLFAAANNIENAYYQDIIGYNAQNRNYQMGISWKF